LDIKGLTEEAIAKFHELAEDEWRRHQAKANEAAMQPLLIRLDHLIRQIDLIVELLLRQQGE
jgi:hypothetical protein